MWTNVTKNWKNICFNINVGSIKDVCAVCSWYTYKNNMVDSFIVFVCHNDKKNWVFFTSNDVTMGINIFAMTTMTKKSFILKYLNCLIFFQERIWLTEILANGVYLRQSANEQFLNENWVIAIWYGWKINFK